VPHCDRTTGDRGGFRFSLDGGATLAPNDATLPPLAYTWDLDIDPRDPDVILELHQGRLYRTVDAGCSFTLVATPGDWDQLTRAPGAPDLVVATSVFRSALAYSIDGGLSWQPEEALPADVFGFAIDPAADWHWTFVGRDGVLYERPSVGERWTAFPIPQFAGQGVTAAAPVPARPGVWLVGAGGAGLVRTDDNGRHWESIDRALWGDVGAPPEPVTALVVSWISPAPSDPDVVYLVVNRVGREQSARGIWRTDDGGDQWTLRVADNERVDGADAAITGGTRVFVNPRDADHALFAFGLAFDGYGTDLFRSPDGLRTLRASHFDGFYEVFSLGFGPAGAGDVLFLGVSSDIASAGR
jgi:photosystem II stability/assembly factor-like uncharacterized protein